MGDKSAEYLWFEPLELHIHWFAMTDGQAEHLSKVHPNVWHCPRQSNEAPRIHGQPYSYPMLRPAGFLFLQGCTVSSRGAREGP